MSAPTPMELQVATALQKLLGCTNETAIAVARCSIRAMREPTQDMKDLDASLAPFWDKWEAPPRLCSKIGSHTGASWQSMIDAASPP